MYNKNGTITGNVDIRDVQSACPVTIKRTVNGVEERRSSSDVGVLIGGKKGGIVPDNQGGTAWTISSRVEINKWAKYKPIKCSGLGRKGYVERVKTNFGFTYIPVFENKKLYNVAEYVFLHISRTSGQTANIPQCDIGRQLSPQGEEWEYWVYDAPTGGTASPYRLSDFRSADEKTYFYNGTTYQIMNGEGDKNFGYFKYAMPPFQQLAPDNGSHRSPYSYLENSYDGLFLFNFEQNLEGVTAGLTVRYEDLNMGQNLNVANFYFGIVCRVAGTSNFFAITQETKAGDQGGTEQMGNHVSMALRASATTPQKSAEALLGSDLSADLEIIPIMSSVKINDGIVSGEDHADPDQGGTSNYCYADCDLANISGRFVVLDMKPQLTHISIQKYKVLISGLTAYKGGTQGQSIMTVVYDLTPNIPNINNTNIRVTIDVWKTNMRQEKAFAQKVRTYSIGATMHDSINYIQSIDGNYHVTGNEWIDVNVYINDQNRPFNEDTNGSCGISASPSPSPSPTPDISA